jgi:hypothetical protein
VVELSLSACQKAVCGVLLCCVGNFGTLVTYILGVFLPWRTLAFSQIFLALPYILGMVLFVPETPQYYLREGKVERAKEITEMLHGRVSVKKVDKDI